MSNKSGPIRVGIAGLGTVGVGIVKILTRTDTHLMARAGRDLSISAVSARTRNRDRGIDISGFAWEDDAVQLAKRGDVDLLIEVIGGADGQAKACVEAALAAGKNVITANKTLMATHGNDLAALAEANGVTIRFEAAVAGGIPVIKGLAEGLAGNSINRIFGVLNGTGNYILTEMEKTGRDYADILKDAQALGYAESDPTADVGGFDAAQKLALLASIGFGTKIDYDAVQISGIEQVTLQDIEFARDLGYRIKALGVARKTDTGIEQRVTACMLPASSVIGGLDGVTNAVVCEGDFVGQVQFIGPGAGEGPTASAIIGDLVDIARGVDYPVLGIPVADLPPMPRNNAAASSGEYYIRLMLKDVPGAMADVTRVLADNNVSIRRMRQYGRDDAGALVAIMTHNCTHGDITAALSALSSLEVTMAQPFSMRVETA